MMIRQYKIHTDLDGSADKIFDMNDGKIRFYQPSDLGITTNTNIWSSGGIGVFGDSSVGHPPLEFQLETFGDNLEENYNIFNEFINVILAKKFVTLEYTTSLGAYYADVKLSKVTKTEAYGFNGTFSEKIAFDTITAWYTYQQLKFSKVQNGEIGGNTKIYGNKETTVYPNLNLLAFNSGITFSRHYGWDAGELGSRGNRAIFQKIKVTPNTKYTVSSDWTKTEWLNIYAFTNASDITAIARYGSVGGVGVGSWDTSFVSGYTIANNVTFTVPSNVNYIGISYSSPLTTSTVVLKDLLDAKIKLEEGSIATPWMPSKTEVKPSDYRNYGSYKYDYTYFGEDNIDRFSKWKIEENVFSFVARLTPSKNVVNKKYGLRFLNYDANEYSAIVFNLPNEADFIQINTDINDEYYQAIFNGQAVNMFSALDFQRFRTRLFEKGSMELIGLDSVEMNVKRKVDFV